MKHKGLVSGLLAVGLMAAPLQGHAIPVIPDVSTPELLEQYLKTYIKQNFKDAVTEEQLDNAQLKGMFDSLDPYSNYYTPDEFKSLNESLSGAFGGIGVHVEPYNGYLRVTKPISGSPAARAGIAAGDLIIKVEGKSIYGLNTDNAIALIKGTPGTKVKITLIKSGTNKETELELGREMIQINSVSAKMLKGNMGYVLLEEFDQDSASLAIDEIKKLTAQNMEGLILDLRDNPGGYLSQAVELADFFLPKGVEIMGIDYKNLEDEVIIDEENGYNIPVVILVNKNSASASEIVTSALQKNGRAKVVGVTTYGKGTVQDVIRLPKGDGFKLTVAEYQGPHKTKINGVGVKPDFLVAANDPAAAERFKDLAPMTETKVYKAGESGLNVYGAQQRLNLLGSALKLTGKMDAQTVAAIRAHQKANKLKISGQLDVVTKKSLEEKTNQLYNRITSDVQLEKALEVLKGL